MKDSKSLTSEISPQIIVRKLVEQLNIENITLPDTEEELWDIALQSEVKALMERIKSGIAYKALKEMLQHGEFEAGLKERGIKIRTAQRNMAVADLFLNSSNTSALTHFSFTGLLELTQLPEVKVKTLENKELEELSKLPSRALASRVKEINDQYRKKNKLEQENERLRRTAEKSDTIICELQNRLVEMEHLKAPSELKESPLMSDIKGRAPMLTEQVNQAAIDLSQLASNLLMPHVEQTEQFQGAELLYHFLLGPYQRLGLIIKRLQETCGEELTTDRLLTINFDEQEWHKANDKREYVIDDHQRRFNPHLSRKSSKKKG